MNFRTITRVSLATLALVASLSVSGCRGTVGVGVNVSVPVGNHGYMTFGGSSYNTRWH